MPLRVLQRFFISLLSSKHIFAAVLLCICAVAGNAASIRGIVTDASGARVSGATVDLLSNGQVMGSAVSGADGSYQILTGMRGRFFLVVSATKFRQLETPDFYAGQLDNIERNIVLEPEWVHESIVVTATGTPTPQPQTGAATSVIGPAELESYQDLVSSLRVMPGTFVAQEGQRGAQTSLFVRGGNSDGNLVLIDGVNAGDLGGRFDFGPQSTTAMERSEIYRGPNSSLYGAGAESGVVSMTTPHGTTDFPSLIFHGDWGSFISSREELEAAGTFGKLDYLGAYSWQQTANDLPHDEYHVGTVGANLGFQPTGSTKLRGTLHYGVDGTGVPGTWEFHHLADNATEKDQDLYISGSIDNQTTADFHNMVRYGATRKREQYNLWEQTGAGVFDAYGDSFGDQVTITGANGYAVSGRALMDFGGIYPQGYQLFSNRDALVYQGDYTVTPHLTAQIGFGYEDERYTGAIHRTNYDYRAAVHGDFKNRLFYMLGGDLEHYSLFGVQTSPRAGLSFYAFRPRKGVLSGTRLMFNFGDAVREPSGTDQLYSLYTFLEQNPPDGPTTIQQMHISPIGAPTSRTYEGGLEQAIFSEHLIFKTSFFHNEFGRQIEYVGLDLIPQLLPNLSSAQQIALEQQLQADGAYELTLNTEAYRAMGVEATMESGIGRSIFLRGGYTYLDATIQRSYTNDDVNLLGPVPTFNGIPVGPYAPLVGARPFRRPPHAGFFAASYSHSWLTMLFNSAFASRSDDSDFLAGYDINGGNTLLLPNRNLDHGYAKLDFGGTIRLRDWLGFYALAENLTNNQHIAPIGYVSLPTGVRLGLKFQWGKEKPNVTPSASR
ncbi:TonB-dependent receptor plug domain-containing protein [Telmatobacter sp. DSM 110680]|uniref:TonB-dependent receptor plug domain-containing protein n=1 Tax=Telmatobacter sp. DSM 110680 TaxID=3036704 RepID=A0AAU7DGW9_9BACT